jgi:hypothetical protein
MAPITVTEMQGFVERCDPNRPLAAGDPLYVELDEGTPVRGGDGTSCIDEIERTIVFSDRTRPTCQLFTGFPGTGKTTELNRLRARLDANKLLPTHTVMIDFEQFVDRFLPISISDVLRVLAYSFDREATVAENKDPEAPPAYLRRFFDFLARTEVELRQIGFDAYGASLMLELKNNPGFRQKAEAALALRFQAFAREAMETMAESVVRLRAATGAFRIVVLVDGLEKLTPLREEDRSPVESAVETLFVQHASWLHLPCDVVYTFPLWLRFRTTPLGALYDREPYILPMVKIAEKDGADYEPGLMKLAEIVRKRVDDDRVFGPAEGGITPVLRDVLRASGGYPRDVLRMIREMLWMAKRFPVSPADATRILSRVGESYAQAIRSPDVDILVEVAQSHTLPSGDMSRLGQFGRLLDQWLILAYRNGHEWYDLHPLVRRARLVATKLEQTPSKAR